MTLGPQGPNYVTKGEKVINCTVFVTSFVFAPLVFSVNWRKGEKTFKLKALGATQPFTGLLATTNCIWSSIWLRITKQM